MLPLTTSCLVRNPSTNSKTCSPCRSSRLRRDRGMIARWQNTRTRLTRQKEREREIERKCLINRIVNAIDFRLECVVNALCRGLGHAASSLSRLVLDMNLSGEQVSRVCEALRGCVQVQALHLPHLGCGCEGLASVAELLKERPLLALNLAGSWGTKNEDPSSSGISMGKTLPLLCVIPAPLAARSLLSTCLSARPRCRRAAKREFVVLLLSEPRRCAILWPLDKESMLSKVRLLRSKRLRCRVNATTNE